MRSRGLIGLGVHLKHPFDSDDLRNPANRAGKDRVAVIAGVQAWPGKQVVPPPVPEATSSGGEKVLQPVAFQPVAHDDGETVGSPEHQYRGAVGSAGSPADVLDDSVERDDSRVGPLDGIDDSSVDTGERAR